MEQKQDAMGSMGEICGTEQQQLLNKVVKWIDEAECSGGSTAPQDPMDMLHRLEQAQPSNSNSQRWIDLHKSKYNSIDRACRALFDMRIDRLKQDLSSNFGAANADDTVWRSKLSSAVVAGNPADFSSISCNEVYTLNRLKPRCRQLHHLIMHDNPFSKRVRSYLLPSAGIEYEREAAVRLVSLGGGPAFDHIAISLVQRFLSDVLRPNRGRMVARPIRTQVFDLFAEEWRPIVEAVRTCLKDGLGGVTVHHADLRKGFDHSGNDDLKLAIETADLIVAMFVLHENWSTILEDGPRGQRITGALQCIFERAQVGAMLICCDSANTLYPAMRAMALHLGWIVLGDKELRDQKKRLAYLGPKAFLIFERVRIDI